MEDAFNDNFGGIFRCQSGSHLCGRIKNIAEFLPCVNKSREYASCLDVLVAVFYAKLIIKRIHETFDTELGANVQTSERNRNFASE